MTYQLFRSFVVSLTCLSLIFSGSPFPFSVRKAHAQTTNNSLPSNVTEDVPVSQERLREDLQLAHWVKLDQEMPALTEFALGKPLVENNQPLWKIDPKSPVLDEDPYFLRTQGWVPLSGEPLNDVARCESICTGKTSNGELLLSVAKSSKALQLRQKFTAVLETETWIFLAADTDEIFKDKISSTGAPAQGLFFLNKNDLVILSEKSQPVPVFHLPLPGRGWLASEMTAREVPIFDKLAFKAKDGFILDVEKTDVIEMEELSRKNFTTLQVVTFVTKGVNEAGIALPEPKSTMAFGLIASTITSKSYSSTESLNFKRASQVASSLLLPTAHAADEPEDDREKILAAARQRGEQLEKEQAAEPAKRSVWRRWLPPVALYGSTGVMAYGAAQHIDWTKFITDDMPQRILTVASIFGVVAVTSLVMRYTIHRDFFDKKYPKHEATTLLEKINREHKAFMDEFVYGLRFSAGATVQTLLRSMDYLKDRMFPGNKMIHEAWNATLGFYIQASSRLPIDYRCFYLGAIVFGMSDALMVAVDLLIFTPYIIKTMGITSIDGAVVAAFASATVLSNFLSYLQTGALTYSMDIRMIHMDRAKKEAQRILSSQGIDVENPKNAHLVKDLQEEILSRVSKSVGLPGQEAFLYDAITVMEKLIAGSGYSLSGLSPEQREKIKSHNFVLKSRHWGLIVTALNNAINNAKSIQRSHPSEAGAKTIEMLEWALKNKNWSSLSTIAGVSQKVVTGPQSDTPEDLESQINDALLKETVESKATAEAPLPWWKSIYVGIRTTLKYATTSEARKVRDIRMVLFLMSTTGSVKDVLEFLPPTWTKKSGSPEVAQTAAELFHRDYMALFIKKAHTAKPTEEMIREYSERAERMVQTMSESDAMLSDSFIRQARKLDVIAQLYEQDQARIKFLTYEPDELSRWEKKQWDKTLARVESSWDESTRPIISESWKNTGETYQARYKENDTDFNMSDWINDTSKKLVIATELAKQFGLEISDINESRLVQDVVLKSSAQAEGELSSPEIKNYTQKLSPREREHYEARIFYRHFVSNYFDQTITNDKFDAYSKEFPGRFQPIRAKLSTKTWGKPIINVLKALEIGFRSDAAAYSPGLVSKLNRSVPLVPDFYHNFVRGARSFPFSLTVGYGVSYYIWQIHMPYPLLVFGLAFSFLHPSMVEMNNRIMRNYNIKPMDDVPSKLTYSFIHSRLTNPQVMFEMIYATTIVGILTTQNIALGVAATLGFFGTKYYWKTLKDKEKQRLREEMVVKENETIELRQVRCLNIFSAP